MEETAIELELVEEEVAGVDIEVVEVEGMEEEDKVEVLDLVQWDLRLAMVLQENKRLHDTHRQRPIVIFLLICE